MSNRRPFVGVVAHWLIHYTTLLLPELSFFTLNTWNHADVRICVKCVRRIDIIDLINECCPIIP